ncbi:MAG: hypothetical protein ACTSO9_07490 [Candidatus Helarchaeota archaeon]
MKNELEMLEESNLIPFVLSFLRFAIGEKIFATTGADPFVPWPTP